MRAVITAILVSVVLQSAAWASAECDFVTALRFGLSHRRLAECSNGKAEERLDCLTAIISQQQQEIAALKCDLEQLRTAKIVPLNQQGRAD